MSSSPPVLDAASSEDAGQAEVEAVFQRVAQRFHAGAPTPLSTYRLQLTARFGFEDARKLLPYLDRLGVSDLYLSPITRATPGSGHGYDVVDHTSLNPELGSAVDYEALCRGLAERSLGQLLDIVPNHMGIERENALWEDVLENGPSSRYARFFDIDWDPVKEELGDKVLLPILGDQYGAVLERGELALFYEDGRFGLRYFDHRLPIGPRQYATVLRADLESLEKQLSPEDPALVELHSILTAIDHLPVRTETDASKVIERGREKEVIKRRLAALVNEAPAVRAHLERNVAALNGRAGEPHSFDGLHAILEECSYRLAHWRVAGEEINYRRFFDINGLAAIRVEDPEVFAHAHALVFDLLAQGKLSGLRIDHPDGLFDPTAYFLALQEAAFLIAARQEVGDVSDEAWQERVPALRRRFQREAQENPGSPLLRSLYVVIEKIQGGKERIPESWAVHGTTGYRFANAVSGIFVDSANEGAITGTYHRFLGEEQRFGELLYQKKRLILAVSLSSEVNVLARELNRISEMSRRTRDFTLNSLRQALVAFIAHFPVYRTYVDGWRAEVDARDVQYIEWTIASAKRREATLNASIFDFLRDILLLRYPPHAEAHEREVMLRFAMKMQQLTGPVMAKGLEDTVFYVYNRLSSLNEVGGEPERFGTSVSAFHLRNQERAETWPAAILATSTHDTKRSEDVRARINVLSEYPAEWEAHLRRWESLNRSLKTEVAGAPAPSPNDEYLFYQSVLGAYPMGEALEGEALEAFAVRMRDYMLKAIREAKVHTSWTNPDSAYDDATAQFVLGALSPKNAAFLAHLAQLKRRLERAGQLNSLGQVTLKLVSPGVADFYQGSELWDLSLVDPDNRRPVDFALRMKLLEELDRDAERDREALCRELWANPTDGRVKLYTVTQGLRLRRRRAELFRRGGYVPLEISGESPTRAVACWREHEGRGVGAVVPRLVAPLLERSEGLGPGLSRTFVQMPDSLEGVPLREVYSGRTFIPRRERGTVALSLGKLLEAFPVALLETTERDDAGSQSP
jgi:(1->4)-alpha-D-glucan 1-alpha-D-glucosylmutase